MEKRLSWTNALLFLNTTIFVIISIWGMDIFSTDPEILVALGAKDPVGLAQGQLWRLATACFLHVGVIHFLLNAMALRVVGRVMEESLGGLAFIVLYLGSGIFGNIFSSYANVVLGAGASGAIFGLIGSGLAFEWLFGMAYLRGLSIRPSLTSAAVYLARGPFATVTWLNFALAIVLNGFFAVTQWFSVSIDNSAHLGGLIFGFLFTYALLWIRPNRLQESRPFLGYSLAVLLGAVTMTLSYNLVYSPVIANKFLVKASETEDLAESYYYLTLGLKSSPENADLLFARARIAALAGEILLAIDDLGRIRDFSKTSFLVYRLISELKKKHMIDEASQLEEFMGELGEDV